MKTLVDQARTAEPDLKFALADLPRGGAVAIWNAAGPSSAAWVPRRRPPVPR
ncbi:hypothetical protein [Streptomyces sp. NPDC004629]|uniref:hypothetical protein n=1 Tax=Streptomyces sp. NPDC004629 TaxID=3364705 RepID=UPI003686E4C4